jgi:hypothetical protein
MDIFHDPEIQRSIKGFNFFMLYTYILDINLSAIKRGEINLIVSINSHF